MGVVASYQLRRADRRMAKTLVFVKCAFVGDVTGLQAMMAKEKISPDAQDRFGMTALHWAAYGGKLLCVQELLKAGASLAVVDLNGRNALHHACRRDHDEVVRFLVSDVHVDVNSRSESKDTPLHKAVMGKSIRSIEVLLQLRADPTLRNDQNRTPLDELDADPSIVKDTVPEPIPTARMKEELDNWRREFITEVQSSGRRRLSVEALLTPKSKHTHHQAPADPSVAHSTLATKTSGRKYKSGPNLSVREVENTLVTSFQAKISEFSDRSSSASDLPSSRQSSARFPTGRLWAKASAPNLSASSGSSSADSSARRDSGKSTIVPLNLQGLTPSVPQTQDTATSQASDSSSIRSLPDVTLAKKTPRPRNLRYAGKRVIMALRVKKLLSGDEKREMIRLILLRHMKVSGETVLDLPVNLSIPPEITVRQGSEKLVRSQSGFTLSLPSTYEGQ